jgi:hypothetical protein
MSRQDEYAFDGLVVYPVAMHDTNPATSGTANRWKTLNLQVKALLCAPS